MIYQIADIFKTALSGLSYVDTLAGIVKPLKLKIADQEKTIPAEYNARPTVCTSANYYDLVPDGKKKSIIYLEDKGTTVTTLNWNFYSLETQLRIVCWFNYRLTNVNYFQDYPFVLELISLIPEHPANYIDLARIRIKFTGQVEKSPAIFSDYTYNETQSQYLTYPYDYFALDYLVSYSVTRACIEPVILNPSEC